MVNPTLPQTGNGNLLVLSMPVTSDLFTVDGIDLNENGSGAKKDRSQKHTAWPEPDSSGHYRCHRLRADTFHVRERWVFATRHK